MRIFVGRDKRRYALTGINTKATRYPLEYKDIPLTFQSGIIGKIISIKFVTLIKIDINRSPIDSRSHLEFIEWSVCGIAKIIAPPEKSTYLIEIVH